MDIWQTLEIEPTPDQKAIKRAYAKKLKVTRPDENAEAFQSLHHAYKAALHQATYWEDYQEEEYEDEAYETEESDHQHESINPITEEISLPLESPITGSSAVESISETAYLNSPENSTDEIAPEIQVNPLQLEGERLLGLTELFLATSNGGQNNPKNWTFIIESPFILEDQFNWRLGLELLQIIRKHNHNGKIHTQIRQEVLCYLDTIFNWTYNRHQVLYALGDEYTSWLDTIKDPETLSQPNWKNKIRGGKNLLLQHKYTTEATQSGSRKSSLGFSRFCAFFLDSIFLFILIGLLASGESTDQQAISNRDWIMLSMFAVFIYFGGFEASILRGTPGKKIMKLAVITDQGESLGTLHASFRTFCFFMFYIFFFALPTGLLELMNLLGTNAYILSVAMQAYGVYLAVRPITIYDKISKTRVIQI